MMESKETVVINQVSFNLDELEKDCWNRLVNGAIKSRDAFHTPCVGSISKGELSMRTVVLRKALPLERELRFHTDIRSRKWEELSLNNSISALFYDVSARIQLRVKGKAILHFNDEITLEAWQKTSLSSRRCYLTLYPPSSFSDIPTSGLSEDIEQEKFTLEESECGQQHFGIVDIQVESIDWLWLNHAGHRRAYFDYMSGVYKWMVP
ncbi:pyridoxamine 5'-phosphate oxidase family protein [Sediminibacterium sp.]|uniref:pyridoxamine 5'-phosphate oxidase family protein n=1 Tax=Sediminibacterium sp. TaxID=1917865 RepID=UPI0027324ECC|nr:pyridoxamine 5'-phosphate oxidase family protein [Sediminibacterium sp.]MDP3392746.1 pyridoxamine 5'-phosphate oxidase family protein [Sediminibacterium sp.]MDP3565868.1 pyridoxamine 5'-phosphate oxidase family protein [Sediminibacterium sp.]